MPKLKQLIDARAKASERMNAICDAVEARESKTPTDEEKTELSALERELNIIDARIVANRESVKATPESQAAQMDAFLREAIESRRPVSAKLERSFTGVESSSVTPLVPLTINDVVQPLEKGLIYHLLGLPIRTGLAGDYCWPVLGAVEASFAEEKVALADSTIPLSKLTPEPQRLGITIPVTQKAITQSQGVALDIVKQQIPLAVARTLNRAMFCPEKYTAKVFGPFTTAAGAFAGTTPTYKELIKMKGEVYKAGIANDGTAAYVMSEALKAELEATPVDPGSGRMVVENGAIAGIPVFCTEYLDMAKNGTPTAVRSVAFGVFSYFPIGQFGETRFTFDPFTGATTDSVRLTLNAEWAMTVLRSEAFIRKTCKAG